MKLSWSHVIPEHHFRRRVHAHPFRSININVIPSFGHIVNVSEPDKNKLVVQSWCRLEKLRPGEARRELFMSHPRTLTHHATLHSAWEKLSRSQLTKNISMNMSKDQGLAGDSDSDCYPFHHPNSSLTYKRSLNGLNSSKMNQVF